MPDHLGTLGAGMRISLEMVEAPVNIGPANSRLSSVGIGPVPTSPIGPKVVVSVQGAKPGDAVATSYMAHLSSAEAVWLAGRLLDAAATIAEAEQVLS